MECENGEFPQAELLDEDKEAHRERARRKSLHRTSLAARCVLDARGAKFDKPFSMHLDYLKMLILYRRMAVGKVFL